MATLPPLAEPSDLENRLGRAFADEEADRAEAVLADASALARAEAGRSWVSDTEPAASTAPDVVKAVVLRVAERCMRNPDGFTAEAASDYSYQRSGVQDGVYLTEREAQILRRAAGRSGLWTQRVTARSEVWDRTEWVYDQYGLEPFPVGDRPDW